MTVQMWDAMKEKYGENVDNAYWQISELYGDPYHEVETFVKGKNL